MLLNVKLNMSGKLRVSIWLVKNEMQVRASLDSEGLELVNYVEVMAYGTECKSTMILTRILEN